MHASYTPFWRYVSHIVTQIINTRFHFADDEMSLRTFDTDVVAVEVDQTRPMLSQITKTHWILIRLHLIVNLVAYVPFWSWFAAITRGANAPQLVWMTGFGSFIAIDFVMHVWQVFIQTRLSFVNPNAPHPAGRVAMIVTKAPCEPWIVVKRTLEGMLAQDSAAPYDVWLADEDPVPSTLAWCAEQGVRVSCRKGVAGYHNAEWPRRARCKEGNLMYFYDTHGYDEYDFVFQFDSDHTPEPDYLTHSLPAFADSRVAYVAMPSINRPGSWISEARQTQEAWYYGPSQMSYSYNPDDSQFFMPMMTGSHYAVRTSALRAAGGIGPELDEDMTTTMMLAAHGFRGVYAANAIAFGDGPETFDDAAKQEFQWARSAIICYIRWRKVIFPKSWTAMAPGAWFRVLVVRAWYPLQFLWCFFVWIVGAPLVVYTGGWCSTDSCHLSLVNLALRLLPIGVCQCCFEIMARRNDWLRARGTPFWSIDLVVYRIVRPVWITLGIAAGLVELAIGKVPCFGVTPKGREGVLPLRVAAMWPFVAIQVAYCTMLVTSESTPAMMMVLMTSLVGVYVWVIARHFASQHWRAVSAGNAMGHVVVFAIMITAVVGPAVVFHDGLFTATNAAVFMPTFSYAHESVVVGVVGCVMGVWAAVLLTWGKTKTKTHHV